METIKQLETLDDLEQFERELNEIDTEEPHINKTDIIEFIQEEVKTENENNNIQVNENNNIQVNDNNNIQVNDNNNIQLNENDTLEHIPEIEKIEPLEPLEKLEEVNINTIIQQPKKKVGRPIKYYPEPRELTEEEKEEIANRPKRGRPKIYTDIIITEPKIKPIKKDITQEQQSKKRGRPKKIINPEEPKITKNYYKEHNYYDKHYYKKKGTKSTGRPKTDKPEEEIKQNKNKLIKDYYNRRGKYISKILYYDKNYNISNELKEMKTETFEDLEKKLCEYIDFVNQCKNEIKKQKLTERINISKSNKGVLEIKRELRESQKEVIEM